MLITILAPHPESCRPPHIEDFRLPLYTYLFRTGRAQTSYHFAELRNLSRKSVGTRYRQPEPYGLAYWCHSTFTSSATEHVAATRLYAGINFRPAVNPPLRYVYKYNDWRRHTEEAVKKGGQKILFFVNWGYIIIIIRLLVCVTVRFVKAEEGFFVGRLRFACFTVP
ncbi:ACR002Cp [Eremothecium gossypii ATCC 10895]|uniref:ACR002Cp n=1 Tax=Eremothecium gossypii (strain ATCC 10895 / CBS 109.51 / FGSC 9923 / NRRL Y-1056) TaxID=284811 RepID=Q75CB0_EREGS|nr:ACR002Cp [Eremothecium gossypii ATCC 10895]AAS51229.1 ACR002Cp [Eremothecium gossypii ATCC 10895]AEY95520.1 FACR002Cp [Eremothecium gossypii FDAG1]